MTVHQLPVTTRRSRAIVGLAVALVALIAACGDDDSKGSPATTAAATSEPSATSESTDDGGDLSEGATVLALMAAAELEPELDAEQLACIDEVFDGADLSEFGDTFDPFGDYVSDDAMARTGQMFDDCLDAEARIEIVFASMTTSELGTTEQMQCSAEKFDQLVLDAGNYEELLTVEIDVSEEMFDAFEGCGIDMGGTSDGSDDESAGGCEAEQLTIETAIEVYFVENAADAEGWEDLYPELLSEDPSERWELDFDSDGVPFVVGIGDCAGYGA